MSTATERSRRALPVGGALPDPVTFPDCLRDQYPPRQLGFWAFEGVRLLVLVWTAEEWAALPLDARPLDAAPLGDMMALLVVDGLVS